MVTVKDVAREAKVSPATVSRVLSKSAYVSPEKRERVLAAMRKLGYVPNLAAQSLRGNEPFAGGMLRGIGVIVSSGALRFSHEFFAPILDGIHMELKNQQQLLAFSRQIDEFANDPWLLNLLSPEACTGLIFVGCSPYNDKILTQVIDWEIPVVLVEFTYKGLDAVIADKRDGMRQAVCHLVSLGHKRLIYVGPRDERAESFEQAVLSAGLEFGDDSVVEAPFSMARAYEVFRGVLGRKDFTGIVAACDTVAIGVIRAIHDAGLSVPEDLSVIGFDDLLVASFLTPRLTTVAVNKVELGRYAVRRLIDKLEMEGSSGTITICPVHLVVRESTSPPRT
ncbi:MAG TPA: LacI family transcriptional regulator [Firmicutes bacterium]|nr:LacI family transcriptional regulator [Bacillota bacterium]